MKFELDVKKDAHGLFSASISVQSSKGAKRSSLSLRHENILQAISKAMEPFLIITPNLTQDEVDAHFTEFP